MLFSQTPNQSLPSREFNSDFPHPQFSTNTNDFFNVAIFQTRFSREFQTVAFLRISRRQLKCIFGKVFSPTVKGNSISLGFRFTDSTSRIGDHGLEITVSRSRIGDHGLEITDWRSRIDAVLHYIHSSIGSSQLWFGCCRIVSVVI
jgi:hypothetical protein